MNTKKEFKWFTISQWEKEEEYLRTQQKMGWELEKITWPGFYTFRECEPQDVVYRLDYTEESQTEEYQQLFQDCGWDFVLNYAGYSYFRKPAEAGNENENEIFGDVQSKLDMCKRVIWGRMLPMLALFCCGLVPQLALNGVRMQNGDPFSKFFVASYSFFVVLYLWSFCNFAYHYFKVKKRQEQE